MSKNKCCKTEKQTKNTKQSKKPADIVGKIEVADKRERRDGPGGN